MTELTPIKKFEEQLLSVKDRWQGMLPESVPPNRFIATVMTAVSKNKDLLRADRNSLVLACIQAASHGLLPDGREGAILTFKDRRAGKVMAQWVPMFTGIARRLRELGDVTSISAYCVYKGDEFEVLLGDDPKIYHKVDPEGSRAPEDVTGAYCIYKKGNEVLHREVMTREEIDQARGVSRAANGSAWKDWYGEMARKTVIRRGSKSVPLSAAAAAILEHEDQWTDFNLKPETHTVEDNPLNDEVPPKDVNEDVEDAEVIDIPEEEKEAGRQVDEWNEKEIVRAIGEQNSSEDLEKFAADFKDVIAGLPAPSKGRVRSAYGSRLKKLRKAQAA